MYHQNVTFGGEFKDYLRQFLMEPFSESAVILHEEA